jgi:hypothetical protein
MGFVQVLCRISLYPNAAERFHAWGQVLLIEWVSGVISAESLTSDIPA